MSPLSFFNYLFTYVVFHQNVPKSSRISKKKNLKKPNKLQRVFNEPTANPSQYQRRQRGQSSVEGNALYLRQGGLRGAADRGADDGRGGDLLGDDAGRRAGHALGHHAGRLLGREGVLLSQHVGVTDVLLHLGEKRGGGQGAIR